MIMLINFIHLGFYISDSKFAYMILKTSDFVKIDAFEWPVYSIKPTFKSS